MSTLLLDRVVWQRHHGVDQDVYELLDGVGAPRKVADEPGVQFNTTLQKDIEKYHGECQNTDGDFYDNF